MEVKSNNTIINKSKLIDQSKQNRIEGLDSLRGIFCLWVVVYHMQFDSTMPAVNLADSFPSGFIFSRFNFMRYGIVGVDGFFSISGFIMTHVYKGKFMKILNDSFSFKGFCYVFWIFMVNRIARLYPLVIFSETLQVIIYGACKNCLYDYLLIGVYVNLYNNIALWSLMVEFQLYWCFPLYIYFIHFINKKRHSIIYVILSMIGPICMIFFYSALSDKYLNFLRGHSAFLTGVSLYFLYENYPQKSYIFDIFGLLSSLSYIILIFIFVRSEDIINKDYYCIYIFYYLLLIRPFLIAKYDSFNIYFMKLKILLFFGDLSYTIYLLHLPIINYVNGYLKSSYKDLYDINQLLMFSTSFSSVILLAIFSYHYIEIPARAQIKILWTSIEKWIRRKNASKEEKESLKNNN